MTLHIGDLAPDIELPDDSGQVWRLSDQRGKKVIVYFYPKDDTPGCTAQACNFRDHYGEITDHNAVVVGISADDVASHAKFKAKKALPFPLLADVHHTVCQAYGVWSEKSMFGHKYMGITRSHVVIGPDGRLLDVQIKVSPGDSLKLALKAIGG